MKRASSAPPELQGEPAKRVKPMVVRDIPDKKYNVILADPPWTYRQRGKSKTDASYQYDLIGRAEMETDVAAMIAQLAADTCMLFLWTTGPKLEDAYRLIRAAQFEPLTIGFVWLKTQADGGDRIGLGYYTRSCTEFVLVARSGSARRLRISSEVGQMVRGPRRESGRKPDDVHAAIERLVGPFCPKIELFARAQRHGWDVWGNEVDKFTVPAELRSAEWNAARATAARVFAEIFAEHHAALSSLGKASTHAFVRALLARYRESVADADDGGYLAEVGGLFPDLPPE